MRGGETGAVSFPQRFGSELPAGRLSHFMKRTGAGGTLKLVLTKPELLRKLAALVPPPRVNLTR